MDTISPERIDKIIRDCLLNDDEIEDGKPKPGIEMVLAEGVIGKFGFHVTRLESHRQEVSQMVDLLPKQFHPGEGGGGWSFLNMCMDKNSRHWGEHRDMDNLVCLGSALGLMRVLEFPPRRLCYGGMPYIKITGQKSKLLDNTVAAETNDGRE